MEIEILEMMILELVILNYLRTPFDLDAEVVREIKKPGYGFFCFFEPLFHILPRRIY